MNKIATYLSSYFGDDNITNYPGLFKKHGPPESLEYIIDCANHGVMFDSKDELMTLDLRRL